MKRYIFLIIVFLFAAAGTYKAQQWNDDRYNDRYDGRDRDEDVSFNYFYSTLSPYGDWIEVDNGLYAWKPYHVSHGWRPYTIGRWAYTNDGWYWDSYEPFGWAVYHYGRWYYDDYYGWMWIPDYQWGPSWVEWRYDDDYVGWAPLPPYAVFRIGVGLRFTFDWHFPYNHWNYIPINHFCDDRPYNYFVGDRIKYRIHEHSRFRDGYDYRDGRVINRGVDRDFIERRGRVRINERDITVTNRLRDNSGRGNPHRIEVFRPDRNEINRYRNIDRINAKRSDRRISLDVNKVEIGDRNRERRDNPSRDREVITRQPERNDRQRPEVRREENVPNVQRNDNRERIEPKVFERQRNENPVIEPRRPNPDQPRIEYKKPVEQPRIERRNEQESRAPRVIEARPEQRRVEARHENEQRPQPQVRERKNEAPRKEAPARDENRRNSGGGERNRDRNR